MDTKKLRQKILDLAIRGKLVPQDPNDEPASVLIQRIREEKEKLIREKKIKRDKNESFIFRGDDKSYYEKKNGKVTCIDQEIPFEVPQGWEWVRLKEIFDINPRNTLEDNQNVSFIPMNCVSDGFHNKYNYQIKKWGEVKKGFTHFQQGDIGVAKITPCFENRKSVYFNKLEGGYGAGTTELHIFRTCFDCIIPLYGFYFFKTQMFINAGIESFSGAVGQQRVSKDFITETLIPLPPLAEQKRIVSKIEKAFLFVESLDNNKTELQQYIQQTKSKVLDLAIRGKLVSQDPNDEPASILLERIKAEKEQLIKEGKVKRENEKKTSDNSHYRNIPFEIPKNWVWCDFSDILVLLSGRDLLPREYNDNQQGIPYLTGASNISKGLVTVNRWTTSPKVLSYKRDILLTCKGSVGEIAINKENEVHIARQIMAIRSTASINVDYIMYYFSSYIEIIKEKAKGIIPGISREDILIMKIPLPPFTEQDRIVHCINTIFHNLTTLQEQL